VEEGIYWEQTGMFKSIQIKLTFYFSLIMVLILVGITYLLYQNSYVNKVSNLDGSLYVIIRDMINEIEGTMVENDIEELQEDMIEINEKFTNVALYLRIIRYDPKSNSQSLIVHTFSDKHFVFKAFNFNQETLPYEISYETVGKYRKATQLFQLDDKNLFLVQATTAISLKEENALTLISINFIILFFSILGFYFLLSKTLLSVHRVVMSVNEIEAYDYTKRISTQNVPSEIKALVETFNKLLVRHEASFSKISQFSSDASHELKTPLTSIRGELEVGLRRERSISEYQDILTKSLSKIIDIQDLIEGLLFLAKTDKLEIQSSFEEVYVDEIITEAVEDLREMLDSHNINLFISLVPLTIQGNYQFLKIVVINLLKNAIIYSDKDKNVEIKVEERDFEFVVFFQDQGVGISQEDLAYVFERLYRVNKPKQKIIAGTGLGLSIVKSILDIHDFTILIESSQDKGTVVKIVIPK